MKKLWIAAAVLFAALCLFAFAAADTAENIEIVYTYITETLGYNRAAACGIMSNIQSESNFRPDAIGDNGNAYGICQWNSRRQSLINYCERNGFESWKDIYGQLGYLGYELENNKKKVGQYLRNVPDTPEGAYQAGYYFCVYFEIPANRFEKGVKRGKTAVTKYFVMYGGSYETYTVNYRLMGGSGSFPAQSKIEGVPLTIPGTSPVLRGYLFSGWAAQPDAAQAEYLPGDEFTQNRDMTLWALWKRASIDGLLYNVTDKGCEIIGLGKEAEQITIPEEIEGLPVYAIRAGAFTGSESLNTVSVPKSVTEIDDGAFGENICLAVFPLSFAHSFALREALDFVLIDPPGTVHLSGALSVIEQEAFADTAAVHIDLGDTTLEVILSGAFDGCEALKTLRLPASVSFIAPGAIPGWVTVIAPAGSYAADYARQNGCGYMEDQ